MPELTSAPITADGLYTLMGSAAGAFKTGTEVLVEVFGDAGTASVDIETQNGSKQHTDITIPGLYQCWVTGNRANQGPVLNVTGVTVGTSLTVETTIILDSLQNL